MVWNFYENMDEFVYIIDMDSCEVVYLNRKAREAFGISIMQELAGKQCYEGLPYSLIPCSICTNEELESDIFKRWHYHKSILGRYMVLYDTMIEEDGRHYRIVGIDTEEQEVTEKAASRYQNMEILVNHALSVALQKPTPDETIQCLLEQIGHILNGERVYIFEKNDQNSNDNTYEWVATGIASEQKNLQSVPISVCESWYLEFRHRNCVIIRDLEEIRETDPMLYTILKPRNIRSLVAVPLKRKEKTMGFYGIDNPPIEMLEYVSDFLNIMGHFLEAVLSWRDLVRELFDLSYRDQQTGLGSRYALRRFIEENEGNKNLGVTFCDIVGLKTVNDELGHKAGDQMIVRAAECLQDVYDNYDLFRLGGDEMVVLCLGIEENVLKEKAEHLREIMQKNDVVLSIGTAWASKDEIDIDRLLSEAEVRMYQDKANHYKTTGIKRRRH